MKKVGIRGWEEMRGNILRFANKFPKRVASAMYVEAEVEMTESKRRVPVEHGTLRASGFVDQPKQKGRNISVVLSYGGAAEDYAIVQHERLDFNHPRGGQAKYLESVLNESRPYMAARIARRLMLDGDF